MVPQSNVSRPMLPLLLVLWILLNQAAGEKAFELFHVQVKPDDWSYLYRILSGHFVHLNWRHAIINCIALIGIWILSDNVFSDLEWLVSVAVSGIIVSVLLTAFSSIRWYAGFSGILHAIFVLIVLVDKNITRRATITILVVLCLKLSYEALFAENTVSESIIGINVVVEAHVFGVIAGMMLAPMYIYRRSVTCSANRN